MPTVLALRFLLLALATQTAAAATVPDGLDAPEAREAAAVFCRWVEARNTRDAAGVSAATAPDLRWLDADGENHPRNAERLKTMLAWEGVLGATWGCRPIGFADGWLEAEASERNRMYDALGVGALFQRNRVRVEGGRIREGRTLSEWSTGRSEDEAFAAFRTWLAALPAERRAGVMREGRLIYDADSARRELPLLDEYETAHPPARRLLAEALDALGGEARIAGLRNWLVSGRGRENLSAELQGIRPFEPTWRPHEETLAVVALGDSVAWQRRTPRNDQSVRWRRFVYTPTGFGFVDFSSGDSGTRDVPTSEATRVALARRIPHLLLLDAATRARRLVLLGERRLDGAPADAVEATISDGSRLTLLLAGTPRVLVGVEYAAFLPGLGDSVVSWRWLGWKADASLGRVPSAHEIRVQGTIFQEVSEERFAAGSAEAAAMMDVPKSVPSADGAKRPIAPPPAGPADGEVAPGARVVDVRGFRAAFFEFSNFVAVLEAPASAPGLEAIPASGWRDAERATEELVAKIAQACPGKPVRFVIVSHPHSDHLGGVRAFAASGVTFLAAPSAVTAVRRAIAAPHALAPDRWPDAAFDAGVEAVADRRVISDGRRRIEVVNVGENPHTSENLFVWLPDERLLFQGDLFYYQPDSPFPPSGRGTMNAFFSDWLSAHGLSPKAIYGFHDSGAAPPEALSRR